MCLLPETAEASDEGDVCCLLLAVPGPLSQRNANGHRELWRVAARRRDEMGGSPASVHATQKPSPAQPLIGDGTPSRALHSVLVTARNDTIRPCFTQRRHHDEPLRGETRQQTTGLSLSMIRRSWAKWENRRGQEQTRAERVFKRGAALGLGRTFTTKPKDAPRTCETLANWEQSRPWRTRR